MNSKFLESKRAWTGPSGHPLRVLILDCPYDTIQEPLTQRLLGQIVAFKIRGYGKEYPYGVLPIDTVDFVCVHIVLCEEVGDELVPIMGMKSITAKRCEIHHLDFPALHFVEDHRFRAQYEAIEGFVKASGDQGKLVGYNGSWTISPETRSDRELVQLVWNISIALMVQYYKTYKIDRILVAANLKYKINELKEFIGYEYLKDANGVVVPPFESQAFDGISASLMTLSRFSFASMRLAKSYQALWDNRITIDSAFYISKVSKKLAA